MAQKYKISRPNVIKLGIVGLAVIIVFGVYASLTNSFVPLNEVSFVIPFDPNLLLKPIKLDLASDFTVECRIWVQGNLIDTTGAKTFTGFQTKVFNPQFNKLDIINIHTEDTIKSIESEIHARCDPAALNLVEGQGNSFTLTGGSLQYYWTAKDEDNTVRIVTSTVTVPISPSNDILQDPNGAGIILAKPTVTGQQIDDKLTSTKETYFTSATLVVLAKPEFQFKVGCVPNPNDCALNQKEFATVNLNAGVGTIKVFNVLLDPAKPTSEKVDLVKLATVPSQLFTDSKNINLEVRVDLPQWKEDQGLPLVDIFKPSSSGSAIVVLKDRPLNIKKLIDPSTNTYEFSDTNIAIPDNPSVGTWIVKAKHNARSGEDIGTFVVSQQENQEKETPQDNPQSNPQDNPQDNPQEKPQDNGLSSLVPLTDFLACLKGAKSDVGCLSDSSFYLIWAVIGIVVIIAIASAVNESKPRY